MACECGHLRYDHARDVHSTFPCVRPGCRCSDYAEALSDAQTAADITLILTGQPSLFD